MDCIRLIYAGPVTAEKIMEGGCFDKAVRAHLLIDAGMIRHIMKKEFTTEEIGIVREAIKKMREEKLGSDYSTEEIKAIVLKFNTILSEIENKGRTPALWMQYHTQVDTVRIYIRAERVNEWKKHLGCISTRMLDAYAGSGHHQYAKGARLYVQKMVEYESNPRFKVI